MGIGKKILLFIVGLMLLGLGAWIITALIFAYLFTPPLVRLARRSGTTTIPKVNGQTATHHRSFSPMKILGAFLLVLSLIALSSGGTFSPIVFGVAGLILIFFKPPRILSSSLGGLTPIDNSILLRGKILPFKWFALAEVKVSTRDAEGALSGMKERLLLIPSPNPRMFFVFSTTSTGRRGAEEELMGRMHATAKAMSPLGIYLLPIDGRSALQISQQRGKKIHDVRPENLMHFLSSADFGAFTVESEHGFVTRYELYQSGGPGDSGLLSQPGNRLDGSIMLREALQAASHRVGVPKVDRYVAFLSSMAATEGETLGQRITQTTPGTDEQSLLVASLGSPQVEISRAQLRAVSQIYQ
jgi:hypothetical protein